MQKNKLVDLSLEFFKNIVNLVDNIKAPKSSYMINQLARAGTSAAAPRRKWISGTARGQLQVLANNWFNTVWADNKETAVYATGEVRDSTGATAATSTLNCRNGVDTTVSIFIIGKYTKKNVNGKYSILPLNVKLFILLIQLTDT